jgi:beta-galactosidase
MLLCKLPAIQLVKKPATPNKVRIKFLFFFLFLCANLVHAQRDKYNFNSDWRVFVGDTVAASVAGFNDAMWKRVTLPYAWNEDDAFKKDIAELTTGIAWYRKHFKLPAADKGKKIFIEFEGIRQAGDFYVNGRHIGVHENGVMAFGFDITDLVNFGDQENIIAARIDNDWNYREKSTNTKFQWEDKNFNANYGGISKNVLLHVTGKTYQTLPLVGTLGTTGVYVYADQFDIKKKTAVIHAESQIKNETDIEQQVQYEVVITDLNNQPVKRFAGDKIVVAPGEKKIARALSVVQGLNFWSWGYGYLYNVQTIVKINGKPVDIVLTRTGFRKTAFQNGMVYLNDRVIQVKGYAQRTSNEWPAIGLSVPAWLSDYSNGLMVKSNANLVRWMHITPWKQDIESCDRMGLMQAMPAGDAERDVEGARWEQRKSVMRDAIVYNRNNPSIIFYECGNESISEQHMKEMKAIRDEFDPHGGRAIGSREMLDSKAAEYGGEMLYINKSADIPMWAMEYSRDEGLRKYWDDYTPPYHKDGDGPLHNGQDASIYNRNMESHAIENVKRWYEYWAQRPGTGKRVSSGGVNIVFSETNTHHRGAENYRRSGEVDAMRIIKQNYYAHLVMWDGWVDVEKPRIHIIGHWNYEPGVRKNIFVISSADKVELKVNGKAVGYGKQTDRFLFTFGNIEWQPGSISAIGYDAKGKQLCRTQLQTAGRPVAIRLTHIKSPRGFIADGHDLALIEAEVIDAKGNRCPTALNMISFSLLGPAEWRGGMAQGPGNYILSKDLPVEGGVNRVLIRSTRQGGVVSISASADGLKDAALVIVSKAQPVANGLSKIFSSQGLPSNLQRGPAPLTPSYKVSRTPVTIIGTTAGANADSAFASYDDNELSDWVNDGKQATAWIEYELDHEAEVKEVVLKLNNFRSRTYPLLITVDGKEIYNDTTQRTLGYFTAVCKPQRGKKLRIQLAKATKDNGEQMTEVTGKKLDDGVTRNDAGAPGRLSIIEVEIYEGIRQ